MRLLSITLRNYRVHKDLTIGFDSARNLIGGPNECGKSTLAEAIHRALFLRAKTGGNLQREMISTRHLGDPEVTLAFDACGGRWQLEKRFAAAKGSALLTDAAGAVFRDDEAEMKLAELLKCETNGGRLSASQLPTLWSHLWVWQGSSGSDPAAHATQHKDHLVQRLQQDGIAAVMQSPADQRVRERIAAAYDELFTATGKSKAGSAPELARAQLDAAKIALNQARETAARLETAAIEHQRAENDIASAAAALPDLRAQKEATAAKLTEAQQLQQQEETRQRNWQAADLKVKQFAETDAAICQLEQQVLSTREQLAPAEHAEATLVAAEKEARGKSETAEASQRQTADSIRQTRLRHDLAAAAMACFEKSAAHHKIVTRAEEAAAIAAEIKTRRDELNQSPPLSPTDLESLRELDRAASQADAGLAAMATGIEVLDADLTVTIDGETFAAGDSRTLTDAGEIAIGPGTRLRIRPGGGGSLADARQLREKANRAFQAALDRHTLRDLDHAAAVLHQRQTLGEQMARLEIGWKSLGGESLSKELTAATTERDAARAELQRRHDAAGPETPPESLEAASQLRESLQQMLDDAAKAETSAQAEAVRFRKAHDAAANKLERHREQTAQARQALRDLETRLQVLRETHGDADARSQALTAARASERELAAKLAATRAALAALVPDALKADLDRLERAITAQENRRREAEDRRLTARALLTLDGSSDPHAELSHAQARHTAAADAHAGEQRRAQAVAMLHQLFTSSREAIHRSLVQPLADRIAGYLQCLFGPASQVRVNLSESGIDGLELLRPDGSAFDFATLSGGAKEQVAAAVRLAMAEILAADHDGCLPLVFDDAFAYTDPERVQFLQRMLDLAALRGLQVIVLTCTPDDYSGLGASEIRIPA